MARSATDGSLSSRRGATRERRMFDGMELVRDPFDNPPPASSGQLALVTRHESIQHLFEGREHNRSDVG